MGRGGAGKLELNTFTDDFLQKFTRILQKKAVSAIPMGLKCETR
jgi:hypothetical protein